MGERGAVPGTSPPGTGGGQRVFGSCRDKSDPPAEHDWHYDWTRGCGSDPSRREGWPGRATCGDRRWNVAPPLHNVERGTGVRPLSTPWRGGQGVRPLSTTWRGGQGVRSAAPCNGCSGTLEPPAAAPRPTHAATAC